MPDTSRILQAIGQASYIWDIQSGAIEWSDNFRDLIGIEPTLSVEDARQFDALLSADSPQTRFSAVHHPQSEPAAEAGVPYQCTYAIRGDVLKDRQLLWIEDTGRWYPDDNGKPARSEGIVRIVNERRQREEKLRKRSEIDELTGIANRQMLQSMIRKTADDCFMNDRTGAFLLIALDEFERVNHTYGFSVGDEVLQKVSWLLRQQMRDEDYPARFSGAKFGLILKEVNNEDIELAAKRLVENIGRNVLHTTGGPLALKLSAGACLLPTHALGDHDAIAAATAALDRARNTFGTTFCLYEPEPEETSRRAEEAKLLNHFVKAIENNRIKLAFQPVVDATSGAVVFHEALLRLEGVDDSLFDNADFIDLAENLGLMRMLDQRALQLGLECLEDHPEAKISINVTHDSLESGIWMDELKDRIHNRKDLANRLLVELTESHLPRDIDGTINAVQEIKALGCRVAIDDFGAGYTSFSHLRDLRVDIVKIDGSYVRDLTGRPENEIFLNSVRNMTESFGIKTVVEWVEDIDTALRLKEMGHDHFQGSLYGMPLTTKPWNSVPASSETRKTR